jgi:hypothetical protein
MPPSREQRIAALVRRGILPSVAERIVNEAEADGQRILAGAELAERFPVDAASIEQARQWWLFSTDVPTAWRRILDARQVPDVA